MLRRGSDRMLYARAACVKDGGTVDLAFVEQLVQVFERSSLAELDYSEGDSRLRLARRGLGADPAATAGAAPPAPQAAAPPPHDTRHVVQASFPGVFYRSTAAGEPPLVQVGDMVEDGQTLGLLEAMKLFNRVQADAAGRIAAIPVEDGATVESGAALFILDVCEDVPEPPV